VSSDRSQNDADTTDTGPREVTVPLRIYKAVTVFSTLVAIICVILGFAFLDAATAGTGPLSVLFNALGVGGGGAFTLVSALVGLAFIGLGAGTYVLGTRFRTAGMGKSQDDSDEPSDNE
jgi:Na+-translocating ferredoxin:NAD+ oxidoreductase RnfE subunit